MKAVIQRVKRCSVEVGERTAGSIEDGLLVLLGIGPDDTGRDADYLLNKIINLRIFEDAGGRMNLSLLDTGGGLLVVSQFTLMADCRKGRRPSFVQAARPEQAEPLYDYFVQQARRFVTKVATGVFGAHMLVEIANDGPVTIILDSEVRRP